MPTFEVRFGPNALKRAIAEADGRHTSNAALILRDPAEVGLTIRVSGKSVGWYLRWDGKFKRLAGVGNPDVTSKKREKDLLYTCTDASQFADNVRELMKVGKDVDAYIAARSNGATHEQAAATEVSRAARDSGAWNFATLVERFITEKISEPTIKRNGSVKPAKDKTIKEAKAILRHPDVVAALDERLARDLRKRDIEAIRDAWWAAGAKGRQHKLVAYVKSAFTWAKRHHSAAQLDDVLPWWVELRHHLYASQAELAAMHGKPAARPLTAREVATLLHVAESNRVGAERKIRLETTEIALAALWWVALTAQRTHAAFQATIARVDDRTEHEGWYDVSWIPVDMKGGRHFSLAVPPEVFDRTLGRALRDPHRRGDSVWVFPSSRTKLRGKDEHADKPVGDTILNNLLGRLRGLKDGKKVADDQLAAAGLPHFTLHELRDALTTHLSSHTGLPGSTASAILDHASEEDREPDAKEANVTRDHYNKSQRLALKFAGLQAWSEAVISEYEKIRSDHQRELAKRRLARPARLPSKRALERGRAALHVPDAASIEAKQDERPRVMMNLKKLGVPTETDDHGTDDYLASED